MIYRAQKHSLIEPNHRSSEADISYLQGLRSHKLELVKSEVSLEAPPSFLTNTPLGEAIAPSQEKTISHGETSVRKKQPSRRTQKPTWLLEELSFTMNKMSLAGLVFGLMVLGTLFFVIGFLAAVATLGTNTKPTHPSWSSLNSAPPQMQAAIAGGTGLVGQVAGKLLRDEATKLQSKMGGGVLAGAITQHVPAPLQPFAQQAQNRFSAMAQQNINRAFNPVLSATRPTNRLVSHGATPGAASPFAPHQGYQPQPQAPQGYPTQNAYPAPAPVYPNAQQAYTPAPRYNAAPQRGYAPPPQGYGPAPSGYPHH